MLYPKRSLIKCWMFILGMSPLHEQPRIRWHNKVRPVSLLLAVLYIALTIHSYVFEVNRLGYLSRTTNNIISATVVGKRLVGLLIPVTSILPRFCYIRTLERFWEKFYVMDKLMCILTPPDGVWEFELEQKQRKANFYAGFYVIGQEIFNLSTTYLYFAILSPKEPLHLQTIYIYHYANAVYTVGALNIVAQVFGLVLKFNLFIEYLDSIAKDIHHRTPGGLALLEDSSSGSVRRNLLHQYLEASLDTGKQESGKH